MRSTVLLCASVLLTCTLGPTLMAKELCPETLSYQDIQDIVKPDGKNINGLTFEPKSLPDYLANMPKGDVTANLTLSSDEGAKLVCTYVHHGGVAGAGNYHFDIIGTLIDQKK